LQAADKIVKIDGKSTKNMTLFEAVKEMRGKKGTDITITIVREGLTKPKDVTITRDVIKIKSVKYKLLDEYYGYIRIAQFQENTDRELVKALKALNKDSKGKMKGLILDLRNNPGGLLEQAVEVADEFLAKGKIVYTDGRAASQKMEFFAQPDDEEDYPFPMVVLVNGGSASAAEIVAGALQDHDRAVILGSRTFGKGSVQTIIPLDDGSGLKLVLLAEFNSTQHQTKPERTTSY